MKINTLRFLAKEGAMNVYKNKLMSILSILTAAFSLFIMGIVFLISINITSNIEAMKLDLGLTVFLNVSATPTERADVVAFIENEKKSGNISQYRIETKEQAFENLKKDLKNEELLKGLSVGNLPESFYIKLTDPVKSEELIKEISLLPGVNKDYGIGYSKDSLEKLQGVLNIFNYIIISLLIVLMIISVFLIYNTIRLTVFARRNEIEIMKYVGAIDSFVREPFIIEGLLIGFSGAVISFIITSQAYIWLQNIINSILQNLQLTTLRILEFGPVAFRILILYVLFGIIIGGIGSLLSVKKHLAV